MSDLPRNLLRNINRICRYGADTKQEVIDILKSNSLKEHAPRNMKQRKKETLVKDLCQIMGIPACVASGYPKLSDLPSVVNRDPIRSRPDLDYRDEYEFDIAIPETRIRLSSLPSKGDEDSVLEIAEKIKMVPTRMHKWNIAFVGTAHFQYNSVTFSCTFGTAFNAEPEYRYADRVHKEQDLATLIQYAGDDDMDYENEIESIINQINNAYKQACR